MVRIHRTVASLFCVALFAPALLAQEEQETISNWAAPAVWSRDSETAAGAPEARTRALAAATQATSPVPFIGVTPCRLVDTRGNGFTGQYGPPLLSPGSPRSFTLTGQCAISTTAQAVSLNITVTNTAGTGFILVYPQGGTQPLVSTLNYVAGQTVANAAVVALGSAGGITVAAGVHAANLIIDTNGYYAADGGTAIGNTFLGVGAGNFTMSGARNTAMGDNALDHNTTGNHNTAVGSAALLFNTTGGGNTAIGSTALFSNTSGGFNMASGFFALGENTTGSQNTASGSQALMNNTTGVSNTASGYNALISNSAGSQNTAVGDSALLSNTTGISSTATGFNALRANTGDSNTADGAGALQSNTTGFGNVASGFVALNNNTTGGGNTASGAGALQNNVDGSNNIALGYQAGLNLVSGDNNIYIRNLGVGSESNAIRIGTLGFHNAAYIQGIIGSGVIGAAVQVDATGRLGVATSSSRFKEDIRDLGDTGDRLLELRPVRFRYKPEIDPAGHEEYGLVAEEVAQVYPDLITCDGSGRPETVRYTSLVPLLIDEVQKDRKMIEDQRQEIQEIKEELRRVEVVIGSRSDR